MLEDVGIDPDAALDRRPHEFSGGQAQRISIARALVLDPKVIICDEPVSALDVSVQAQVLNLLEDLKVKYGISLIFIAHDLGVVKNISDRVVVMYLGKVCEVGPPDDLFVRPLHPYTEILMSSIPVTDPSVDPRDALTISRRAAVADRPAVGMPVPHPLPARRRRVRRRRSRCCGRWAAGQFVACHFPIEHTSTNGQREQTAVGARRGLVTAPPSPRDERWRSLTTRSARQRPGKTAIMRAAVAVMGEVGYEAASVRDMAARAGVSVAALYYHFPSKADLLREFLDEAWEVSLARIERRLRLAGDDPFARLDSVVGTIVAGQIHDDFAKLASNVALRDHVRLAPPERTVIEKKLRRMRMIVERVIVEGNEAGEFTIDEPSVGAKAILALTNNLAKALSAEGRTKDEVIAIVQRFSRASSRPDQPHALIGGRGRVDPISPRSAGTDPDRTSVVDRAGAAAAAGDGVAGDRRRCAARRGRPRRRRPRSASTMRRIVLRPRLRSASSSVMPWAAARRAITPGVASVRVRPGCTTVTLMPCGPSSSARFFVIAATATLRIEPMTAPVLRAPRPEMLMIRPQPWAIIAGRDGLGAAQVAEHLDVHVVPEQRRR